MPLRNLMSLHPHIDIMMGVAPALSRRFQVHAGDLAALLRADAGDLDPDKRERLQLFIV